MYVYWQNFVKVPKSLITGIISTGISLKQWAVYKPPQTNTICFSSILENIIWKIPTNSPGIMILIYGSTWRGWTRTWSQLVWKQWGFPMIAGHNLKLKQSTFFCCVEKNNSNSFHMIFRNRKGDINAYNDEVQRSILNMHGIFFLFCYIEILNCRVASLHLEFCCS